jgi:predicted XRE-type DNA-binding protein
MYSTRSRKRVKKHPSATSKSAGNVTRPRKNIVARQANLHDDKSVFRGSFNVFKDLGFDSPEAASLKIRADLMLDLRRFIQDQKWSQGEAAAFFRETQPRISNLLKGEISRFSVDKLINMLARAGIKVRVETDLKAA